MPSASSSKHANGNGSSESKSQGKGKGKASSDDGPDHRLDSIRSHTRLPTSLQQSAPLQGARPPKSLSKIPDKKLRANLSRQVLSQKRAEEHAFQADRFLHQGAPGEQAGLIETEHELERTARLTQGQIRDSIGVDAATKSFALDLSGGRGGVGLGPYRSSYTPNGRQLLLAGRSGHLASFDWQSGKLGCEIQVKETVRDATWLHNASFFATAQKKHVYIYDGTGAEVHRLKDHVDVNRLQFLRYHFLLASIGSAGWLKYQDTSTGQLVAQHRTKLGACDTMAQNPSSAVMHLGHSNGTVTLWTPNMSTPALTLLAHHAPVTGLSINPQNGGREMATAGLDGFVKVWDCRMLGKGPSREWMSRRPVSELEYSQRGLLATSWGSHVSIYNTSTPMSSRTNAPPGPYLTNNFPKSEPVSIRFCPFEDVLGAGHGKGFTSLIVPGSGEPRFDSMELDPFESKTARREREVRGLLDKIQPDMISIDPSFLGQLDTRGIDKTTSAQDVGIVKAADGRPYSRLSRLERLRLDGQADEGDQPAFQSQSQSQSQSYNSGSDSDSDSEDQHNTLGSNNGSAVPSSGMKPSKEKYKARGKNSSMKRYMRKKRSNVIDANSLQIQAKLNKSRQEHQQRLQRSNGEEQEKEESALDLFSSVGRNSKRR
ncbi:unnamed protein product [Sympodiomycopsis kandeliae]